MSKVRKLQRKTMNLEEMRKATLSLISKVRNQLHRMPHDPGLSDMEFMEQVLTPFECRLRQDREVLLMANEEQTDE